MEWPLVGRSEQLDRIVAALSSGGGLVVHGPAGVGKTRLLTAARERVTAQGTDVRWVLATSASQAVPFGPVAHLLPAELDPAQPGGVPSAVAAGLTGLGRPVALAVDDGHLLDVGSAALLQHLAQATRVPFVVTIRDGEPAPDAVTALWKDLGIRRLALAALDRDEVGTTVAQALDGAVSSSLVDELARLSHGNPMLLRELVGAAMSSGALVQRDGLWVAAGPLVGGDLPAAIADRLERLPPRVRSGAELVAVAEPVGAAIVEQLLPEEVRARLDEEGLLEVVPDRRRVRLRLVHPLYTEALRAAAPPLRAREHARRLAEGVARTGMRRREDRLRVALWHLGAGRRDRADLYLAASGDADAAEDHVLAARLAEAAVDGGGGLPAEGALLLQLPFLGRRAEAETRAEELAGAVVDPSEVVEVAVLRARLYVVGGDAARAQRVLHDARAAAETPELHGRLLVQLADVAHAAGDTAGAVEAVDDLVAGDALEPDLLVGVARVAVRALATAGRADDAVSLADRALDAIEDGAAATATLRLGIAMARCQAVAYAGRFDLALAAGQAGAAASRGGLRGAWLRDVGQALLYSGRPRSGLAALREMMAELPLAGISAASALWSLDAMAEACALLGDLDGARQHLEESARRRPPAFRSPRTAGAVWAAAAGGELQRARDLALEAAAGHARRGAAVPQAQALYDVARLGDAARVLPALERLAAACQGRFVPALARAARALAEHNADALEASTAELEAQGLILLAAELATQAAALYRRGGRRGAALAAARLATELAGRCEGARSPLLADTSEPGGLTRREWEVTTLVARGLTDREVAERLYVSVRTVHSHLHSAYRKLGVRGRADLADVLGTERPRPTDVNNPSPL